MRRFREAWKHAVALIALPALWTAGCGSGTVVNKADFALQATPVSASITAGGAAQTISISATAVSGFSGTVSVSVAGEPAGVSITPSPLTLAVGASQQLSLTAASSATAGTATIVFTGNSGLATHTASIAVTVNAAASAPTPDFSLQISPSSAALTAGGAAQSVTVTAAPANGFNSAVQVSLSGLPQGVTATPSTLTLTPGTGQQVSLAASASAASGASSVVFTGASASLSHTATLALTVNAAGSLPPPTSSSADITTYHVDVARTGLNPNETTLTTSNVTSAQFGLIRTLAVDGHVDAQPLYLSALSIGGQSHNVVYAVTEHDSVYAFDADSGTQLWKTSIIGTGETTSGDHGCSQITPEIGITSTPVIDRKAGANGTIFVVGMTEDSSGHYHQRLHALDVTTGAELTGSPTEIAATFPGTGANSSGGNVVFDPGQYAERAGILLLNGVLYLGWTSHCDSGPYTGWLMGYSESTLAQTAVLNLTPNGSEGSIWMAGSGLAADTSGNIYFLDANGTFDTTLNASGLPTSGDYGNAFMKVSTTGGTLTAADYFETSNTVSESANDEDLGSGGALVLPDLQDSSGTVHHLAVGAGKDARIYIVNRDSMGKFNSQNDNAIYQEISGAINSSTGVFSMPAYFNNTIYYGAVNDKLKAFPISNAKLATTASVQSSNTFPYPGTTPAISANGTSNGIVWGVENTSPAVLHAFDATSLQELYNSNQAANNRDQFGAGNKFITPMIVNGKVFVGTPNSVAEFGLLQ